MLSTGIKSPIGIKVSGTVLADIDATAQSIEAVAKTVPGVVSAPQNVWKAGATSMSISTGRKPPAME